MKSFFTSESVTSGHPDKVCDIISDSILDAYLSGDAKSRVACECAVSTDFLLIMGEVTSNAKVDVKTIARKAIDDIGYNQKGVGFSADKVKIKLKLHRQSPDIAMGVDSSYGFSGEDVYDRIGAGDQGIMFGYACNETPEMMPLPISLAHKLSYRLAQVRKLDLLSYLRPDGKSQVTVEYDDNGNPVRIDAIVVSTQHTEDVDTDTLRKDIRKYITWGIYFNCYCWSW